MTEKKIVMEFTEQQIWGLDAMVTEGFRVLRDDCTDEQREAAVAIVHRIDANRRALLAGEVAPDAKPDSETQWSYRFPDGGVVFPVTESPLQVLFAGECACLEVGPRIRLRRGARDGRPVLREAENRRAGAGMRMTESNQTEDNRVPNFWWCPTHHLYRGGDKRPCADAVRLVPAPPAPGVFLPGDQVPVGTVLTSKNGSPFRVPDAHTSEGLARVGVPFVEVLVPSPEEWQAIVDRARDARAIPEPTEGTSGGTAT